MSQNRSRNWMKLSCALCILLPLIAVLATFAWFKVQISKKANQLPIELAKLKALGVPTEPADLAPNPPIPDGKNAAPLYNELIADLKKARADRGYKELIRVVGTYGTYKETPQDSAAAVAALAKMSGFLDKADRLAEYPSLDFKRNYALGASLLFPEYGEFKEIARWQTGRVRQYLKKGDYQSSLKTLRAMYAMSLHCQQEPTIIGSLVGTAVDAISYRTLEEHLEAFKGNQTALAATRKLLESLPPRIDLRRALEGELVMGRKTVQNIRSWKDVQMFTSGPDSEPTQGSVFDRITLEDPAVRRMYEAKYLQMWRTVYEKMPKDRADWHGTELAMQDLDKALANDKSIENRLNQILFPVFSQFASTGANYESRHRLALLATRLLQDRSKGLPNDLSRYGELSIDPMDGKPMRYSRKGSGFKIWSLGRDGKDDGGRKFYPGMANKDTDEVLHFFYPEKPPAVKH